MLVVRLLAVVCRARDRCQRGEFSGEPSPPRGTPFRNMGHALHCPEHPRQDVDVGVDPPTLVGEAGTEGCATAAEGVEHAITR
jgi:hypothetical protein